MDTLGQGLCVLYREFVLSLEVEMYWYNRMFVTSKCVLIERFFFLLCPLFGVSIIRNSTVLMDHC